MGSFVMFVSHQWNGFNHPDPKSVQTSCMVQVFRNLRDGVIDRVDMDPFHTILYKTNRVTKHKEWAQLLSKSYVWYDFWSQPQPSMTTNSRDKIKSLRELKLAIESMGAYVERADCLVALVPSTVHCDRIDPRTKRYEFTCYRTFRRRAFCVLELFACFLSRRKTHPMLLIRSPDSSPQWVSSLECQKLAVGQSLFTCCERNHKGEFAKCDRTICGDVLKRLIDKKVQYLFKLKNGIVSARITFGFKQWFLRGLPYDDYETRNIESVASLRKILKWTFEDDGDWFDRDGVSILFYAVMFRRENIVKDLLKSLSCIMRNERTRRLVSAVPREGFVEFGITGKMNALSIAMAMSTPKVVEILLDHGIDPTVSDITGNHPFLFACILNRVDNVKYWLDRFPDWDLEKPDRLFGTFFFS